MIVFDEYSIEEEIEGSVLVDELAVGGQEIEGIIGPTLVISLLVVEHVVVVQFYFYLSVVFEGLGAEQGKLVVAWLICAYLRSGDFKGTTQRFSLQ